MHKKLFLLFFSIMILGTIAHVASAVSLSAAASSMSSVMRRPFGGRITTTTTSGILCPTGIGTMYIQPVGKSSTGPYVATHGTNKTRSQATANSWIIGIAQNPSGICYTETEPPVTVTASPITIYGASGFR